METIRYGTQNLKTHGLHHLILQSPGTYLSTFFAIKSFSNGLSSPRGSFRCLKLESDSSLSPRNGRPCRDEKGTFERMYRKPFWVFCQSLVSWLENSSSISHVKHRTETSFRTASARQQLPSWLANLLVASFQFLNPDDTNPFYIRLFVSRCHCWCALTQVKQNACHRPIYTYCNHDQHWNHDRSFAPVFPKSCCRNLEVIRGWLVFPNLWRMELTCATCSAGNHLEQNQTQMPQDYTSQAPLPGLLENNLAHALETVKTNWRPKQWRKQQWLCAHPYSTV